MTKILENQTQVFKSTFEKSIHKLSSHSVRKFRSKLGKIEAVFSKKSLVAFSINSNEFFVNNKILVSQKGGNFEEKNKIAS
jgi:hypothetical protein